jgi:phospholipid/cholesterol/gamma-HCH transport system substrate-binding protein
MTGALVRSVLGRSGLWRSVLGRSGLGRSQRGRRFPLGRAGWVATAAVLVTALASCSSGGFNGIYSIPLPGGASLGSHPFQVTAQFSNVGDLVPQSAVMVNDVAVGRVTRIFLPHGSWTASVRMLVNGSVHLPANAIAQLQQASLLGEQFIALSAPPGMTPTGRLANGAVIPAYRTTANATVEEVLGALSLLLNDGGISQLHTITTQLDAALSGNEPQIRSLLVQMHTLLTNLNVHRHDIETALDGLNSLSATLAARDRQIGHVLTDLTPGLRVLADQRAALVDMLDSLHRLTGVAVSTINASQAGLVNDLRSLAPTLRRLADAGQSLPLALQVLLTYPFTNQVLNDVKGDYLNTYLSLRAAKGTTVIPPVVPPSRRKGRH